MNFIKIILIPLSIALVVQFSKTIPDTFRGKFRWKNILNYGGMPSGHGALVASLCTMVGIVLGVNTVEFGIACVMSVIVLRDSVGLRRIIGKQGEAINDLNQINKKVPALEERVGHTPFEVMVGVLVGIGLSFLLNSVV
ncbi:MAG: divergent PAP2 family protein [Patescibacteria group bacterium]